MYPLFERDISALFDEKDCMMGVHGLVFRAGSYAVKLYRSLNGENGHYFPRKEAAYAEALFSLGVSVPQPYGLFRLSNISSEGYLRSFGSPLAFFCDYVEGSDLASVPDYVHALRDAELEKARNLGFSATDARKKDNALFDGTRVYLIDFCQWYAKIGSCASTVCSNAFSNQRLVPRLKRRLAQGSWL